MSNLQFLLLLKIIFLLWPETSTKSGFQLHILHFNDFHARFEEVSETGNTCKTNCIGGFSRLYSAMKRLKNENPEAIALSAGDQFAGTLWYNLYKWNVSQHFLNKLPVDVYTLGNHEFDDKIKGLIPFLEALEAPVVLANVDDSKEPTIWGKYRKSVVIERGGIRIGVVGVITSKASEISKSGKLSFFDEAEAVNKEAARLVAEERVDTIVVLSHSGYDVEKEIASKAGPKIGLIVGGHSHTFLYTENNVPGKIKPKGPYPTVVKHKDGRQILVVQAACFTMFLGNISINYDFDGNVVSWSGAPIYLDKKISTDKEIDAEISDWQKGVDEIGKKVVGNTSVFLDHRNCQTSECNLGNLIADAMVFGSFKPNFGNSRTAAFIAIINSKSIKTFIEIGNITVWDVLAAQPYEENHIYSKIKGKHIKEFLEDAVTNYNYMNDAPILKLLQVSGIHVVYNLTNPIGSRTQLINVRCEKTYAPLELEKIYPIVVNSFLAGGGDGFTSIKNNLLDQIVGPVQYEVLLEYISLQNSINIGVEGRIKFVK